MSKKCEIWLRSLDRLVGPRETIDLELDQVKPVHFTSVLADVKSDGDTSEGRNYTACPRRYDFWKVEDGKVWYREAPHETI